MKEKVVLAYSGGLDTTAIIPWLKENYDYDVVCVCVDCGQGEELDGLDARAKACGAEKLYIENVVDEFCDDYIVPCVQAHAVYENKYLLGTSMARPLIAKKLVEIPEKKALWQSVMVLQVRVMTRSVSSWVSKLWLLISRSLLPGEMTSGKWIPVNLRSNTARLMASTFLSLQILLTAVTVTSGTSAMKLSLIHI